MAATVTTKTVVVVMTMAEKVAADSNDREGGGRQHIRGDAGS
jgi:hypothetical protein